MFRQETKFLCNNPSPSYLIRIRYLIVGSFYLANKNDLTNISIKFPEMKMVGAYT